MDETRWLKAYFLLSWLLAGLFLVRPAQAEETRQEEETDSPSAELLEFLADWETSDGEWVDPLELVEDTETDEARRGDERDYD